MYDLRDSAVPHPLKVDGPLNGRLVKSSSGAFSAIETREMDDAKLSLEYWKLLEWCRFGSLDMVIVNVYYRLSIDCFMNSNAYESADQNIILVEA